MARSGHESQGSSFLTQVAAGVVVAVLLAAFGIPELASRLADDTESTTASAPGDETSPGRPVGQGDQGDGGGALETTRSVETTRAPETTEPTEPAPEGCQVVITNPLVSFTETPDHFGQEIGRVPGGEYPVLKHDIVPFGTVDERWLLIEVDGTQGWIPDDTFTVDRKIGCEF